MSPRMALYGMLWRAALAKTNPWAPRISLWTGVIVTLALVLVACLGYGLDSAIRFGWNTPFAILLMIWTWFYLPGAIKLNTPSNAQLTPGMRARLVELSSAVWLVCSAGLAVGMAGQSAAVVLPVLWAMLAALGMGLTAAGSRIGGVILISIWPLMFVRPYLPEGLGAVLAHPAFLPIATALLAVPGLVAIRAMLPQAGERHWRLLAVPNAWRDGSNAGRNLDRNRFLARWQARSLRRASERHDLRGLLMHGSGPGLQSGEVVLGIGLLGLGGLALLAFAHLGRYDKAIGMAAETGWMWGLLPLLVFQIHVLMLAGETYAPAGHTLLRLAPALPATAPRFNRLLASTLVRTALTSWTFALLTAIVFAYLSGAGVRQLGWVACLYCLAFPAILLLLRDHARRPRSNVVLQWLLMLAAAGACLLAASLLTPLLALPVLPIAAVVALGLTGFIAPRRYRAVLRAPFAFPAGRLD